MTGDTDRAVILTVDDDPIILNAVLEVLKQDYTVRPFTSGEAALSYLSKNTANLILLDHNMPNMTGLEVLQVLQDDPATRDIPVIFLTGSVDSTDEVRALEIGAMDYLLKPFKASSLLTRVRLQLELYRHRHHLEELVALKTEELRTVNQKLEQRDKVTLDLLAKASDMRDHETGAHIERVVLFTDVLVADLLAHPQEGYQISEQYGRDIVDAVKLHDLGKLAMPDQVLLKPGKLTEEEFRVIKTHPIYGSKMLTQAIEKMGEDSLLWTALEIVYGHHEKWDGSGYPNGIKGDKIPLSARIAAVADVFDALTSSRPYKRAWSPEEAFDLIYADAGKHFDPYLAEIVKRHESEFVQIVISNRDVEQLPTPELEFNFGFEQERTPALMGG
ncbi:MAG: response regulator [Coriobacteriales bacterium]|jgi:putative two-component system response regulator|nr:response regulator [Coriobacteriales bacterium]